MRRRAMRKYHIFVLVVLRLGLDLSVSSCSMGTISSCLVLIHLYFWCPCFNVTHLPMGPN